MSREKYWIWLSAALGAGERTDEVLAAYPDPEKLYGENRTERTVSGVFTRQKLDNLEKMKLSDAENTVEICRRNGWKIYTPESGDYPRELKHLVNKPLVLFVDGDITCLKDKIAIGVVGTRNPTIDSVKTAKSLSADLAASGIIVVSGGALGIDTAAHEGALSAGAPTVCVLGCGLGTRYLLLNDALRREIAQKGALVTEYPPFSPASRYTFPKRNRIISGLSRGVLVVEAGEKSGSLITAACAAEQGREIFAVPGGILNSSYLGTNRLIRDGAKAVTCAADILAPFEFEYPGKIDSSAAGNTLPEGTVSSGDKKAGSSKTLPAGFGEEAAKVYAVLSDEPLHTDEICVMTGLPPSGVITALTELEIGGYAEQTEGKNYIRS